jgi:hypothetical protein
MESMRSRRRVTLRQSFREMNDAEKGISTPGDADFFIGVPLAIWYWIAGVPESASTSSATTGIEEPDWERRDREIWADDED